MKRVSYSTGRFAEATLTPDGGGTFDIALGDTYTLSGGPEGMVYIKGSNAGFDFDSLLVSEYGFGSIVAYQVDSEGNPIADSRRDLPERPLGRRGRADRSPYGRFPLFHLWWRQSGGGDLGLSGAHPATRARAGELGNDDRGIWLGRRRPAPRSLARARAPPKSRLDKIDGAAVWGRAVLP